AQIVHFCHCLKMRFSTLLSLTLSSAAALVLVVYAVLALEREERDLRSTVERDIRVLGSAVRVALENALRDNQHGDVTETLESIERSDHAVDLLVFGPALDLRFNSANALGPGDIVKQRDLLARTLATMEP